jgi:asparagine synthase (glutamine-hydrolysing)
MRFVILVGGRAGTVRAPPDPAWRPAFAGQASTVWISPESRDVTAAGDGIRLGAIQGSSSSEVPAGWGGHVTLGEQRGQVSIFRDPSGRIPAYWARLGELHVVCSHVEDLAHYRDAPFSIDWDYLLLLLLRNFMPASRTGFREVREVLPGEVLTLGSGGATSRPVWAPSAFWRDPFGTAEEARQALREAAEASVGFWAGRYEDIILDLSGGLDSSAVLGLLAGLSRPPRITCLNAAARHAEGDERRFARIAARAAGAPLIDVDLGRSIPDYAHGRRPALQPRPTPQLRGGGLHDLGLAAAQEAGAQAYFTGRGGDHLFYAGVPSIAARDALVRTRNPARFAHVAYDLARATGEPLAGVVRNALLPPRSARDLAPLLVSSNPFVRPEAAAALDPEPFAHPWVAEAAEEAPLGKIRQVCFLVELQRHYDRIGRAEVLEEVNPLISQPLLEASLRTPAWMFAPDGVPRGLQREVFRDLLPPEILQRRSKGATTSHAIRILARNLPYLRERLLHGELVRQGLLDRARLESHLTPQALLDGRIRPGLGECVSAQLWLDQARETLAGPL